MVSREINWNIVSNGFKKGNLPILSLVFLMSWRNFMSFFLCVAAENITRFSSSYLQPRVSSRRTQHVNFIQKQRDAFAQQTIKHLNFKFLPQNLFFRRVVIHEISKLNTNLFNNVFSAISIYSNFFETIRWLYLTNP